MSYSAAQDPMVLAFARQELARYYRAVTGVDVTCSRFGQWTPEIDSSLDGDRDQ